MTAPAAVLREYPPCAALRPYVCGYMSFALEGEEPERTTVRVLADGTQESRYNLADPLLKRIIPAGHHTITFQFCDPWTFQRGPTPAVALPQSFVMGAVTRPGLLEFGTQGDALGVMFNPGYAHIFLRTSADSLTDQAIALDAVWGRAAERLEMRLAAAATVAEKIDVLECELLRRLGAAHSIDTSLQPITEVIERERGSVSVEWLSRISGMSRQHLARKFRQQIGVSPKQFCRFARFQGLMTRLYGDAKRDWARAAAELGYYDQAHLIAEFKAFTGLTPSRFFGQPSERYALATD
jgi:AraC-like DNA-binding protein